MACVHEYCGAPRFTFVYAVYFLQYVVISTHSKYIQQNQHCHRFSYLVHRLLTAVVYNRTPRHAFVYFDIRWGVVCVWANIDSVQHTCIITSAQGTVRGYRAGYRCRAWSHVMYTRPAAHPCSVCRSRSLPPWYDAACDDTPQCTVANVTNCKTLQTCVNLQLTCQRNLR